MFEDALRRGTTGRIGTTGVACTTDTGVSHRTTGPRCPYLDVVRIESSARNEAVLVAGLCFRIPYRASGRRPSVGVRLF